MKFKEGDRVLISRLNNEDSIKVKGTICGISVDDYVKIWIVKPDNVECFRKQYPFSCVTMPESCLDLIIE